LLVVSATVLEYGGDEDLAIAALLHDSVEDQGGKPRLEDVRNRFGDRVANIVKGCSDSLANTSKGEK
jgi:(p)ppGpp synthase/HD superfamily hydrolase